MRKLSVVTALVGVLSFATGSMRLRKIEASLKSPDSPKSSLEKGWVIANHILVSFHVAFISSLLSIASGVKNEVLKFIFLSPDTLISAAFLWFVCHSAIAIHEMGHYLMAVKVNVLNAKLLPQAKEKMAQPLAKRILWYLKMYALIPTGKFPGVVKNGLNYYPDAPFNLAVAASGPRASRNLSIIFLPVAIGLISLGLLGELELAVYIGRLSLGLAAVGLLDFFIADPGKYKEFRDRERKAREKAQTVEKVSDWFNASLQLKQRMLTERTQGVEHPSLGKVTMPWQFRNCGMGGRHTEKEYPESNISMQESMFIPLSAKTYEEAQEMTVKLQYRLKEIIESAPGAKVMGVGSEGGIATYIDKEPQDRVPEQRMWRMMKQAILDCEYTPGVDVAIGLDPAASELENAYREETGQKDSVGMYRFWRDKTKVDMSRDEILRLYKETMESGVPILFVEDGFGELDHAGWKLLMKELGDKIFIIGDDLVTTKDENIENCARGGEINAALIKANQIGTLSETVLAMLTALGYGAELVVSHRSKSPNDPFEAEISTAMNTLGMKAGGGANTERLQKYGRVMEIIALARATQRELTATERKETEDNLRELLYTLTGRKDVSLAANAGELDLTSLLIRMLAIEAVSGTEEATNAGIPSAAATLFLGRTGIIRFKGSTPLGQSAGVDEAVHYVDSIIRPNELTRKYPELFKDAGDGTLRFKKDVDFAHVQAKNDSTLAAMWKKTRRYDGKGCMDAVEHIEKILAKAFTGKKLAQLGTVLETDRELLKIEYEEAVKAGVISASASADDKIAIMQRKGVLGMNAILSMSLALGRAIAARDGKELWQLIREMAAETMAKFVAANAKGGDKKDLATLKRMGFDELKTQFQKTAGAAIKEQKTIYELLREQLKVYPT